MINKTQNNRASIPQFEEDYSTIVEKDEQPEPAEVTPIDKEEALRQLQAEAVTMLKNLLHHGGEATQLKAVIWLLERADKKEPVGQKSTKGILRIGFDDED